ncbi:MAG: hypothetical protein WCC14_18830 [Acidobacteriaceae bacterium]
MTFGTLLPQNLKCRLIAKWADWFHGEKEDVTVRRLLPPDFGISWVILQLGADTDAGSAHQLPQYRRTGQRDRPIDEHHPDLSMPRAGASNNATAGTGWILPSSSSPTATCFTESNANQGVPTFVQFTPPQPPMVNLPKVRDPSSSVYVTVDFDQGSYITCGSTIILSIAVACPSTTSNLLFQTEQKVSTSTTPAKTYAAFAETIHLSSTPLTSCVAQGLMFLTASRSARGSATVTPYVFDIDVALPVRPVQRQAQ